MYLRAIAIPMLFATGAAAHSPLQLTIPANEAVISDAPTEVFLDFKGDIRLTRVQIQQDDLPSMDLELSNFGGFLSEYAIPLGVSGAGIYVIDWRGLGSDGHPMNGTFRFIVE